MRLCQSKLYRRMTEIRSTFQGKSPTGLAVCLALLIVMLLPPSIAGQMKLLSPNTGWVSYGSNLYWTRDGGSKWNDITPVPPDTTRSRIALRSIFFRDTTEGWTVISYPEKNPDSSPDPFRNQKILYSVAHTTDGGDSWLFSPLTYPQLPQWIQETFVGPTDIYFLDSLHGWMDIGFEGNSKPGKLLATVDGAKSWHWVNSPSTSGSITFASPEDGWLVGGWAADQLYVTHDGCATWQEASLEVPLQVGAALHTTFQAPPIFQDAMKGFLVVAYSGGTDIPSKLVTYSTVDRGHTWKPVQVLVGNRGDVGGGRPFAIVDSTIIVATGMKAKNITVRSAPLMDINPSDIIPSEQGSPVLSFVDRNNGWAMSALSGLLATHDGGTTWDSIAPAPKTAPQGGRTISTTAGAIGASSGSLAASPKPPAASSFGSSAHLSRHLGFDMSYVRSSADMSTSGR